MTVIEKNGNSKPEITVFALFCHSRVIGNPSYNARLFEGESQASIADAIRLISPRKSWEDVGSELKLSVKDVKIRVAVIVDRRDKIAHEADIDPANPGFRWPIDQQMASNALDDLERIAEAVFKVAA